jgi:hypothetical protein
MDNTSVLKKVLDKKIHGRRPVGRPKLRRVDNIGRDSFLLLSIRGWRRLAGNRDIWRQTIDEASTQCGLSCHPRRTMKNDCLLSILKTIILGTKANLSFQGLRLFSKSDLQFPVKVNYDIAKIS